MNSARERLLTLRADLQSFRGHVIKISAATAAGGPVISHTNNLPVSLPYRPSCPIAVSALLPYIRRDSPDFRQEPGGGPLGGGVVPRPVIPDALSGASHNVLERRV